MFSLLTLLHGDLFCFSHVELSVSTFDPMSKSISESKFFNFVFSFQFNLVQGDRF